MLRKDSVQTLLEEQRGMVREITTKGLARMKEYAEQPESDAKLVSDNAKWGYEQEHGKATQRHEHAVAVAHMAIDLSDNHATSEE